MLRSIGAVAATALVLAAVPAVTATADETPRAGKRKVSLSVPSNVIEGDRVTVVVKVGRVEDAKVVQLEQLVTQYGKVGWQTVGKAKTKRSKKYEFRVVAGEADALTVRARVLYREGKPVKSDEAASAVWHWVPLTSFAPYYHTSGANDSGLTSFTLNGLSLHGWYTSGSSRTWESRFTLGRHCQAIRGIAGVRDESSDGSSAQVRLLADDVPAYASPTLVPGTAQPFQIALALPYRLSVQADNLSAPPLRAYPAIGDPQLLCTGLG